MSNRRNDIDSSTYVTVYATTRSSERSVGSVQWVFDLVVLRQGISALATAVAAELVLRLQPIIALALNITHDHTQSTYISCGLRVSH